ncbi:S-layer family protein [Tumebacillus sp. BK434]|uniref:S-layer homology domain-containing protein n=1 Tax=Tumebacillus sp. BK434 TaxID=2512169 RepID=UPI0010EF21BA|nr:S-layer homology domain-containing protein [Tumebacillus sp. BK434]TCP53686.1 S-layer family protein [Tumebacillus sp. BK434]
MRKRSVCQWFLVAVCSIALALSGPAGMPARAQGTGEVTLANVFPKVDQMQTNSYRFQAAAGPVTISAPGMTTGQYLSVRVENATTHDIVHDELIGRDEPGAEEPVSQSTSFALSSPGAYNLLISNLYLGDSGAATINVTISGTGLTVPDTLVPELTMRAFTRGEVITKPFDLAPSVSSKVPSAKLHLYLDGELHSETALTTGTHSAIINPASFQDGFHELTVTASRPNSANETVLFGTFFSSVRPSFLDVPPTFWAYGHIEVLHELGMITGYAGNFQPNKQSSRAEYATLLANYFFSPEEIAAAPVKGPFADVDQKHWAAKMINLLAKNNMITGSVNARGQQVFRPGDTITRAEAAVMVGNILGFSQQDITGQTTSLSDFATVPSWAKPSVLIMNQYGFLNGIPENGRYYFYPFHHLTKAQGATILAKVIGY